MKQLVKVSIEYIAGFLDGEGTIQLIKTGTARNVQLIVTFANTDLFVLEAIQNAIGFGSIVKYPQNNANYKQGYSLVLSGVDKLIYFLRAMEQLLIIKQEQCSLALRYIETVDKSRRPLTPETKAVREVMFEHMQQLNRRGNHETMVN